MLMTLILLIYLSRLANPPAPAPPSVSSNTLTPAVPTSLVIK